MIVGGWVVFFVISEFSALYRHEKLSVYNSLIIQNVLESKTFDILTKTQDWMI